MGALDLSDWETMPEGGYSPADPLVQECPYPYYAAILARMRPVIDPSVKRMAISVHDAHFYLHVNVESFATEPQFVKGVR